MSIFGQVWLWSLLAFVIGMMLTWLVLLRPARKRIRRLEGQVATAHAENTRFAAAPTRLTQPVQSTQMAHFTRPAEPDSWARRPDVDYQPPPQPAVTDHVRPPDPGREEPAAGVDEPVAPRSDFSSRLEPATVGRRPYAFDTDREFERTAFQEPSSQPSTAQPSTAQPARPLKGEPSVSEKKSAYASGKEQDALDSTPDHGTESSPPTASALPKRQRRECSAHGADSPEAIWPSMLAVEPRESNQEAADGQAGSLFESIVQPGHFAGPPAPEPPPARQQIVGSVPPGPFGPGSALPRACGGRPSAEFGVKASVTALRYCTEDSAQFPQMVAEVWFRTPADAERVGFHALA